MPTYEYRCEVCGVTRETFQTMSEHEATPQPLACHDKPMERFFGHMGPLLDALANDRIYEGLRATDGTDISTRAKHRAYMRERNLTTIDDFHETWARQARERADTAQGIDPTRTQDVIEAVRRHGG